MTMTNLFAMLTTATIDMINGQESLFQFATTGTQQSTVCLKCLYL
jgi:hypothetical protein